MVEMLVGRQKKTKQNKQKTNHTLVGGFWDAFE